ncbi:hypothetical protein [Methanobrevibacter sp.]
MTFQLKGLSKYGCDDIEKIQLIREVLKESAVLKNIHYDYCDDIDVDYAKMSYDEDIIEERSVCLNVDSVSFKEDELELKYCPECGNKYPRDETICPDCLVHLKSDSGKTDVGKIESKQEFMFTAKNDYCDFESLLSSENISKINQFNFSIKDYTEILFLIRKQALGHFDSMIKANEIDFDSLEILDKVLLFSKSFVEVDYKSAGNQLGYFEDNTIFIDDRQTKSLQITTLIHELSHFILKEMFAFILCKILDASKNALIDAVAVFILSNLPFTQLIDEYCAHNVEGRFTIFGYQDYSSFHQIEMSLKDEMSPEEIEITKMIGNTFANSIKEILESVIDRDLREEIKAQFLNDVLDRPNYRELAMENCQMLNEEGLVKSIWLILSEGCENASSNIDRLSAILND